MVIYFYFHDLNHHKFVPWFTGCHESYTVKACFCTSTAIAFVPKFSGLLEHLHKTLHLVCMYPECENNRVSSRSWLTMLFSPWLEQVKADHVILLPLHSNIQRMYKTPRFVSPWKTALIRSVLSWLDWNEKCTLLVCDLKV